MAKPKFTPDPAPIQGPSEPIEAYVKRVVAWQKAINDRIEDWWPIPLEDRVADLETRNPQLTGTWPIVDYATISFGAEASQLYTFGCGALTGYDVAGTGSAPDSSGAIWYSPSQDKIIASFWRGLVGPAEGGGYIEIDPATSTVVRKTEERLLAHILFSSSGITSKDRILGRRFALTGSDRFLEIRDASDFSVLGTINVGSFNFSPLWERGSDVICDTGSGSYRLVNKSPFNLSSALTFTSGYSMITSGIPTACGKDSSTFIVPARRTSDSQVGCFQFTTGTVIGATDTFRPWVVPGESPSFLIANVAQPAEDSNGKFYWPMNTTDAGQDVIIITDNNGTYDNYVKTPDDWSPAVGIPRLFYHEPSNAIYYHQSVSGACKLDIATNTISCCSINQTLPGWSSINLQGWGMPYADTPYMWTGDFAAAFAPALADAAVFRVEIFS